MTSVTNRLGLLEEARDPDPGARRLGARALQAAATHAELVDRRAAALSAQAARLCDTPLTAEPATPTGVR